ncbi:hypothetical protein [Aliidiomarina indica]|uniref:hypothetical protein n=1 Tax=Aliidiomarina indica TaxID=2749147 RepID=UPI00188E090E|nr:hypothetical protein [Aliidiomarina indica]
MRNSTSLLVLAAVTSLSVAPLPANAEDSEHAGPNWRTLDLFYWHEAGRGDNAPKADMAGLRASAVFREQWLVSIETTGGELTSTSELATSTATAFQSTFLAGYRSAASDLADLYILAGGMRVDVDFGDFTAWESGFVTRAGMRGIIESTWDLNAYLQYSNVNRSSTTSLHAEARYPLFQRIDLFAGVGVYARAYSGRIGVTFHF